MRWENPFRKSFSLNALKDYTHALPRFVVRPVSVNGQVIKRYKAVVNERTGNVVAIVSAKYQLIQHKTVFDELISVLESKGFENARGYINCTETAAYMRVTLFDREVLPEDTYSVGVVVTNSVDTTLAVWARLFAVRQVCSNGMVGTETVEISRTIHVSVDPAEFRERIASRFEQLIDNVPAMANELEGLMRNLSEIELTEDQIKQLLRDNSNWLPDKAIRFALYRTVYSDKTTGYDLYQALTEWISNRNSRNIKSRFEMLNKVNKMAEQLLKVTA